MLTSISAVLLILVNAVSSRMGVVKRVAVVGAGAGGLITADVLRGDGFEVVIYEREAYVGGVWKYRESAKDSPSTPMYRSLRTNLPKQIMSYSDAIPFKNSVPSFLSHQEVQTYLEDFAESRALLPLIKFESTVESISYTHCSGDGALASIGPSSPRSWRIIASSSPSIPATQNSLSDCVKSEEYFDAVIICNGHYNVPLIPDDQKIGKLSEFDGEIMHSVDYDTPDQFKGRSVLVVGSRSSGTDLAREISSLASTVYVSDRSLNKEKSGLYQNIYLKPGISSLESRSLLNLYNLMSVTGVPLTSCSSDIDTIHSCSTDSRDRKGLVQFTDGSIVKVDVILWCTGYAYDYPFLASNTEDNSIDDVNYATEFFSEEPKECRLNTVKVTNKRKVDNLYQQVFSISHPTLSFIGLPYAVVPFPLFRLQASWISSIYSGKQTLPSTKNQKDWLKKMENEILLRYEGNKEYAIEKFHYLGDLQWEYCRFLTNAAGITDEKQLKYIQMMEEIYNDNSLSRPVYTGAPDNYRNSEYSLDYDTLIWKKI